AGPSATNPARSGPSSTTLRRTGLSVSTRVTSSRRATRGWRTRRTTSAAGAGAVTGPPGSTGALPSEANLTAPPHHRRPLHPHPRSTQAREFVGSPRRRGGAPTSSRRIHELAAGGGGARVSGDRDRQLVDQVGRDDVVVRVLRLERAAAAGERAQVEHVPLELRLGHERLD